MTRVAVVFKNKIVKIGVVSDVDRLKAALQKGCEVFEIGNKDLKLGSSWSMFPTVRKFSRWLSGGSK
jgi:hypothetical protein